jgi:UDP-N-acetyl-D-glucosamine dehydrogenase
MNFKNDTKPIVCVQGMGFVGLAMATVVANTFDQNNHPLYNVVGIDLPQKESLVEKINKAQLPFITEDKSFAIELQRAVLKNKNFTASTDENLLSLADIVIVDVHLNILKIFAENNLEYNFDRRPFEQAIRTLGRLIKKDCLVIIETTVPPGFCKNVVEPILKDEFGKRKINSTPLIVHSYERVMPGKEYLSSIRKYFRTFAGIDKKSSKLGRKFLTSVIDTKQYPLKQEDYTEASELAKILENSYRATNIAFIYEWTLLAEKIGVNLFSIIEGIKYRKTHSNIMKPGFGVGGYCLTKDPLLALWSEENFYNLNYGLPFSLKALEVNHKMPLHVIDLILEKTKLEGKKVAILGISYREDVGDSRFSPAKVLFEELLKYDGLKCSVHDPYINSWSEVPDAHFIKSISELIKYDIVVLATRHNQYLNIRKRSWLSFLKDRSLIVDANNILDDIKIKYLLVNKIDVIGVGKGHIKRMKNKI